MSGPKGGSYRVETPAQIEARRLRDARADYARAEQEWATATGKMSAVATLDSTPLSHPRPAAVRSGVDAIALAAAAAALRTAAESATELATTTRRRVAGEQHWEQLARLIERVSVDEHSPPPTASRSRWQADHGTVAPTTANTVDRELAARRVQKRLDALAELDYDKAVVTALVSDIAAAGIDARVDLLVAELDFVLQQAREAFDLEERRHAALSELFAMQARLAAVHTADGDQLRKRIEAAADAGITDIPADLAEAVQNAVAEADAEDDRQHVVRVVNAALLDLGYTTGPEFSTGLSGVPPIGYARDRGSNYGIKLRIEPGAQRFTAQAVKSDATLTSAEEDAAAERAFCDVMDRITEFARREGVVLDVDIHTPPGACAVQTVAAETLTTATAATRRANVRERARQQR